MALQPIPQHDGAVRVRGSVPSTEEVRSPYSSHYSRRFNPVEYAAVTVRLEQELEDAIEAANEAASVKFLAFYRELLRPYQVTQHRVWVSAGMGMATVSVTDLRSGETVTPEHEGMNRGLFLLICEISQALNWPWAAYLDGKTLAGPEKNHDRD